MTYEGWRISYQSSEQAARAAFNKLVEMQGKVAGAVEIIKELDGHEGAEGWSGGMRERIDEFLEWADR